MPPLAARRLLALLAVAFVLGGLGFAVATPLFQNPDEPSHLDLVHHYAHHPFEIADADLRIRRGTVAAVEQVGLRAAAGAVSFDDVGDERPAYRDLDGYRGADEPALGGCPAACQSYQYSHPPLWYLAAAPPVAVLDGLSFASIVVALRSLNVLLAVAAVPLTWYTARQVWPGAVRRPLAAAAVVAFAGPYLATAAAVNNDAAVLVLGAAATAAMARVLRHGTTLASAALLGTIVGVGLLVKGQFLLIAPLAGLAVLVAPAVPAAVARWQAVLAFSVPAAIGAQWWLANVVRDGSLTPGGSELVATPRPGPWTDEGFGTYLVEHLGDLHGRIFGLYGWASVDVGDPWQRALTAGAVALAATWLVTRRWRRPTLDGLRWGLLAAMPVGLVLAAVKASLDVYRTNGEVRGLAPRYVYAALPVVALGVAAAGGTLAGRLPPRWGRVLLSAGVAAIAVVAGAGSFALATSGLYDTSSLGVLLDRAEVVSPVAAPTVWLGLVALGWLVTTASAVAISWRVPTSAGRDEPRVSG